MIYIWPNIEKMSLFDETPSIIKILPRTSERFDAIFFFSTHNLYSWDKPDVDLDRKLQIKSWLNWAAIVAFPNPSDNDPLYKDLENIGLAEKWKYSEEKKVLYFDPLIAVLLELRNFEVHFELRKGTLKNFHICVGNLSKPEDSKEIDIPDEVYISHIDFETLSQTKNIKCGISKVTLDMVNWFNQQTCFWPAAEILIEGKVRYGKIIEGFLNSNGFI